MYYMRSKRGVDTTVDAEGCYEEAQWKLARRQKRGWSGKALWPLGKDWPVSRFLPISRFQPGRFLPKLTLNDTEIMRGSHFPTRSPLLGHTEWRLGWTAVITQLTNWTRLYQPQPPFLGILTLQVNPRAEICWK